MTDQAKPENSLVKDWLKKAHNDELNMRSLLKHRDAPPNGVCFFAQQMAEKYLKAFLLSRKNEFPKTHALTFLLELCANIDVSFSALKTEVALLDTYYIPTRYPTHTPEFTWSDAEKANAAAIKIKEFTLRK